jgi:hypothetical protein
VILHDASDDSPTDRTIILLPRHPLREARHTKVVETRHERNAFVDWLHANWAQDQVIQIKCAHLRGDIETFRRIPKNERDHLFITNAVGRQDANLIARSKLLEIALAHDDAVYACSVGRQVVQHTLVL